MINTPVAKTPETMKAFRISASDTNYFACVADPVEEGVGFTIVVEIYEPGGATPPNVHKQAVEFFYILQGQGEGICDGQTVPLKPGSTLLLPPGKEHVVRNTGPGKLYALTVMVPNEDFAEMIHNGVPAELDDEDKAVLTRLAAPAH